MPDHPTDPVQTFRVWIRWKTEGSSAVSPMTITDLFVGCPPGFLDTANLYERRRGIRHLVSLDLVARLDQEPLTVVPDR